MLLGMIDPVRRENPRRSASLSACLSTARFAANRTRRSLHGDLGFHCSVYSIHQVAGGITVASRSFGSVLMVIASRPIIIRNRRSEEHTSELQSPCNLVCRLLLEK